MSNCDKMELPHSIIWMAAEPSNTHVTTTTLFTILPPSIYSRETRRNIVLKADRLVFVYLCFKHTWLTDGIIENRCSKMANKTNKDKGWTPEEISSLKGKTFVITGATSGTGYNTVRTLL